MVPGAVRRGLRPAARAQELRPAARDAGGLSRRATALATELLRRGEPLRIRARGASMLPSVRDGDVLHVEPALVGRLRPGDLVCYESEPGVLHVHRLRARRGDAMLVRGDALSHGAWVSRAQALGGVVAVERHGRRRPCPGGPVRRHLALWLGPLLAPLVETTLRAHDAWRRAR